MIRVIVLLASYVYSRSIMGRPSLILMKSPSRESSPDWDVNQQSVRNITVIQGSGLAEMVSSAREAVEQLI